MLKGVLIRTNHRQALWDDSFEPTSHYDLLAEVVEIGDVDVLEGLWVDSFKLSKVKVKVGDRVIMIWHGMDSANAIEVNGETLYRVLYEDIVGIVRDNVIDPVAGHVLFVGSDRNSGKVTSVSDDISWWEKDGHRFHQGFPDIGDYIFCRGGLQLENEMYQQFDKVYVTSINDISVSSDCKIEKWFRL